jgi:hypothetical protein
MVGTHCILWECSNCLEMLARLFDRRLAYANKAGKSAIVVCYVVSLVQLARFVCGN